MIQNSKILFASPIVLVNKKDESWRICIDYRKQNEATVKNRFPIPLMDELLNELGVQPYFRSWTCDMGTIKFGCTHRTFIRHFFRTHQAHFEFLVMPFELTNSPSTFQALMNDTFQSLLRRCVLVYFDDIMVYSRDEFSNADDLSKVLTLLR